MSLPIQAPGVDRSHGDFFARDAISPSACCQWSCGNNSGDQDEMNCAMCQAAATSACGQAVPVRCTCGGGGGAG